MTRLYDATFESGSLTGADGFTSITGTPTLDTSSKIKGANSTAVPATLAYYGRFSGHSETEVYISFYINIAAYPASNDRIVYVTNNTSGLLRIVLTSAGRLQLQDGGGTNIGSTSAILSLNTVYRIGIRYKQGGGSDGIAELYLATGDGSFATVTAVSNHNATLTNNRIDIGNTNTGGGVASFYIDNVHIDTVSMPSADTGSTDTPKAVNITVGTTITIPRALSILKSLSITSALTFAKGIVNLKTITLAVTSTVPRALKNVGKTITRTVTSTLTRITNIPHNVLVSVTTILFKQKDVGKIITRSITNTLTAIIGKGYFRNATVVVTASSVIQKNILKPIALITESVVVSLLPRNIGKTIIRTVTSTITGLVGRLFYKTISIVVTSIVSLSKGFYITASVVQGSIATVQRSLTLLIECTINVPVVLSVNKSISMTVGVIVDTVATFSKLLQTAVTNIYFRKNVRSLMLQAKNTALSVLGKNSRSLNLQDTDES